jgi:hypothetical protein
MSGYVKDHKTIIGIFFGLLAIGGLLYLVFRKKSGSDGSGGSGGSGVTTTRKDYGKGGKKHVNPPKPIPGPAPVQSDCFSTKLNCDHLDLLNDNSRDRLKCLPYKPELLDTMCDDLMMEVQNNPLCGQEYTDFFNNNCTGHTHINNGGNSSSDCGNDCDDVNKMTACYQKKLYDHYCDFASQDNPIENSNDFIENCKNSGNNQFNLSCLTPLTNACNGLLTSTVRPKCRCNNGQCHNA